MEYDSNSLKSQKWVRVWVMLMVLFTVFRAHAQTAAYPPKERGTGAILYFGLPVSSFDRETAETQGIKSTGLGISFGLTAFFKQVLMAGLEYGGDFPGDKEKFTAATTGGKRSSSIYINQISLYGGLKTPRMFIGSNRKNHFLGCLYAGGMLAFGEARKIGNCVNCGEDNLDISAGPYLEPEIIYVMSGFGLGLSYRHFFESDYKYRIELTLSGVIYD